jgi:RHS repeat-associated protein
MKATIEAFGTTAVYLPPRIHETVAEWGLWSRSYNPEVGRFVSMDPFEGNQTDPRHQHKYLYAGADPINNVDPSGRDFALGAFLGVSFRLGLAGATFGAVYGAVRGGIDTAADPNATWDQIWGSTWRGLLSGALSGGALGLLTPTLLLLGTYATVGSLGLLGAYGLYKDLGGIVDSAKAGKWGQAIERGGFAIIDALLFAVSIKGAASASENAINPVKNPSFSAGEGVIIPSQVVNTVGFFLRLFNVYIFRAPRSVLSRYDKGADFNSNWPRGGTRASLITLAEDATWYEFLHEALHAVFWIGGKWNTTSELQKEEFVYDMLQTFFWKFLSPRQQLDAAEQVRLRGGSP